MRNRRAWVGVLLGLCAVGAAGAGEEPATASTIEARYAALARTTADALEAHAAWCTKKRLFGKRDETYAALLRFAPEHAQARKKLRYEKGEDGAWVQNARYKPGTNWSRGAVPEHEKRLAAILEVHRAGRLEIYAGARRVEDLLWARRELLALQREEPGEARVAPLLRDVLLRYHQAATDKGLAAEVAETASLLAQHHPDDIEVRTRLGHVQQDGRWMLFESASAIQADGRLARLGKEALEAVEIEAAELREVEKKIELPWTAGAAAADVRAVGTAAPDVLVRIATCCQAAGALFEAALDTTPERREGLTVYVFAEKGEIDTFLDGYPVVDNPSLQQRTKIGLDLVYADGQSLAVRANPPEAQLDLAVNTVLNQVFSDTLLEGASLKGWHAEGITRYLTFQLTGTRLSISVVGRYAGQGGDRHVPESKASWLARAHAQLTKTPEVGLQLMLGKGIDIFGARDAVLSYAFSVYLLDGHGLLDEHEAGDADGITAPFVRRHHETADVDRTCREILGHPRPIAEQRFRAWLAEITAWRAAKKAAAAAAATDAEGEPK